MATTRRPHIVTITPSAFPSSPHHHPIIRRAPRRIATRRAAPSAPRRTPSAAGPRATRQSRRRAPARPSAADGGSNQYHPTTPRSVPSRAGTLRHPPCSVGGFIPSLYDTLESQLCIDTTREFAAQSAARLEPRKPARSNPELTRRAPKVQRRERRHHDVSAGRRPRTPPRGDRAAGTPWIAMIAHIGGEWRVIAM